jgi:hypothetical protein
MFGIIFSKAGNFNLAKKRLVDEEVVSMYEVLKLGIKHTLSIKCLRPLPNMTILVLSMLTFSFQVKQYS